jgi:electron-transferring-flavoprotein dehydrogenase
MLRVASARGVLKRAQTRSIRWSPCLRNESVDLSSIERVSDEVDVCIVGGGPAGLSAAIRLKQLEQQRGKEVRVVVIEKGSEIGEYNIGAAMVNLNSTAQVRTYSLALLSSLVPWTSSFQIGEIETATP